MRRGDFVRTRVMGLVGDHLINEWEYQPQQKVQNMIDVSKLSFVTGFKPQNIVVLVEKGGKLICAFDGEWKGRKVFNIRELYEEFGEWNPGKGVMIPYEQKAELLQALRNLK